MFTSVFMTGGYSFRGLHVVRALRARGIPVYALATSEAAADTVLQAGATPVLGSLSDQAAVQTGMQQCDLVLHLDMLEGVALPFDELYQANVVGTQEVIKAARAAQVTRLVVASTESVLLGSGPLINFLCDKEQVEWRAFLTAWLRTAGVEAGDRELPLWLARLRCNGFCSRLEHLPPEREPADHARGGLSLVAGAIYFLLPFDLTQIQHFLPSTEGLLLLCIPVGMVAFALVGGYLTDRSGSRPVMLLGVLVVIAGIVAQLFVLGQSVSPSAVSWCLLLTGAGIGKEG